MNRSLYTFNDAWTAWLAGSKFPIAFFGDSTFDGANTTDWVRNTLGSDNQSPNAFSQLLEGLLRQATHNPRLRIYNAGFSGQVASWAVTVLDEEFGEASAYNDVKMMGIGFGINDRLMFNNEQAYRDGFKQSIIQIIDWCYSRDIQPFLLTTQAIVAPGVNTEYTNMYPMRTSEHIDSVANEIKRELADEYQLQFIDLNKYTEMFLQYASFSARSIISDRLHFGDIGHKYEAELIFSHLSPRTIVVDSYTQIDYSSQKVFDGVPENWLSMPELPIDRFKVYVDYEKVDSSDMLILSAWVFVTSKKRLTLTAYKGDSSSSTYIKVNGVAKTLTGAETIWGPLEVGLYKLEVYTGESSQINFKGFVLE